MTVLNEALQTIPTYDDNGLGLKSGLTLGRLVTLVKTPGFSPKAANNLIRLSTRRIYAPRTKVGLPCRLNEPDFGGHSEGKSITICIGVNPELRTCGKKVRGSMHSFANHGRNKP